MSMKTYCNMNKLNRRQGRGGLSVTVCLTTRMFWAVFRKNPKIVKRQSSEREEHSKQTAPHDEKLDWQSWFWQLLPDPDPIWIWMLKPPSLLLGFNLIRWKPVFCLSGTRSMTSFQGGCCVQERCYFSLHLVCITVNSRVRVWKERRWQNVLFGKVEINVFYVMILKCSLGDL